MIGTVLFWWGGRMTDELGCVSVLDVFSGRETETSPELGFENEIEKCMFSRLVAPYPLLRRRLTTGFRKSQIFFNFPFVLMIIIVAKDHPSRKVFTLTAQICFFFQTSKASSGIGRLSSPVLSTRILQLGSCQSNLFNYQEMSFSMLSEINVKEKEWEFTQVKVNVSVRISKKTSFFSNGPVRPSMADYPYSLYTFLIVMCYFNLQPFQLFFS